MGTQIAMFESASRRQPTTTNKNTLRTLADVVFVLIAVILVLAPASYPPITLTVTSNGAVVIEKVTQTSDRSSTPNVTGMSLHVDASAAKAR